MMFGRRFVMNSRLLRSSPTRGAGAARVRAASRLAQAYGCALLATFALVTLPDPGIGQTTDATKTDPVKAKSDDAKAEPNLEGAWSGGGEVAFAVTGSRERARCRAHYQRRSKDSYAMQATCATASGKAAQTATVHRVGENRYRGNFHNADYDISGTIFVVVNGNSQSVRLTSSSGSALFRLSR
jgi:hypothetical protein